MADEALFYSGIKLLLGEPNNFAMELVFWTLAGIMAFGVTYSMWLAFYRIVLGRR